MSPKKSDKNDSKDSYLNSRNDPELEKKVDKLMSVEKTPSSSDDTNAEKLSSETSVPSGAPLLPTEKLPDVAKKETETAPRDAEAAGTKSEPAPESSPAQAAGTNSELSDDVGLEDPGTNKAVDEIVAAESDELLDKQTRPDSTSAPRSPHRNPLKRFFSAWWHSKPARNLTILALLLGAAAAAIVPSSRYFLLNSAGVRSSASVTVLDQTTSQPLKNVEFSIDGKSSRTDSEGQVKLSDLRLGPSTLKITKPAFAEVSQPVTVGWGSNPLGEFHLKAVGIQYKLVVTDFLSKKAPPKAEATSGEASAIANGKGEIVLTVPKTENDRVEVKISADNYRTETLNLPIGQKDPVAVELVPGRKHAFISKRSGTFDVYKTDADGKNEEMVLAGTGREKVDTMALSPHPSKNVAALVSTRENMRNGDGFLLSTLTLLDLSDNTAVKVAQSERIQLVDWIGDKLVYVKIKEGASAASVDRHSLTSYDLDSDTEKELASTNYFNDVLSANGAVYYSPAAYNVNGSVGLFKINADGNNKKTVYDQEVWNMFRTSYDRLSVSMGQEWFELDLGDDSLDRTSGPPAVQKTRVYINGPENKKSLWAEDRDGKGTLISYDQETKEDAVIRSQSGLKNPLHWLTDKHIIYRVNNNQETADYIFNTEGGEPRKIRDVTDTAGIDRWYYY